MRCLTVGCNPTLPNLVAATRHTEQTGHRTAAWPVRSAEGQRRAAARNSSGYYDRYNVGAKSAVVRGLVPGMGRRHELAADFEAEAEREDSR